MPLTRTIVIAPVYFLQPNVLVPFGAARQTVYPAIDLAYAYRHSRSPFPSEIGATGHFAVNV
jgi:hypothetical protein